MNETNASSTIGEAPLPLDEALKYHWIGQQFTTARIEELTRQLAEAKSELVTNAAAAQAKFKQRLDDGETTGDPFKNELIKWPGLEDVETFKKLLALNDLVKISKGQEFLLIESYAAPKRSIGGADHHEAGPAMNWCFVLGILSGERIRINDSPNNCESVILPFERYFFWRHGAHGSSRGNGKMELYWLDEPSSNAVRDCMLVGSLKPEASQFDRFDTDTPRTFIFIGDEISPESLFRTGCPLSPNELETVRKGLNAPTKAESSMAEAI